MLRIALDLDGVCYEWDRTARYMLRRKLAQEGRSVPASLHEPSAHWNAIEQIVGPEDFNWLWTEGVSQGLFRYGHVVTGAIEGVTALSQFADVVIVTARPREAFKDTFDWISFMFNRAHVGGVVFTAKKTDVSADLWIDDAPHNALDIAEEGKHVVVFPQPWNRDVRRTRPDLPLWLLPTYPSMPDSARWPLLVDLVHTIAPSIAKDKGAAWMA